MIKHAVIQISVMVMAGAVLWFFDHTIPAAVLWTIAGTLVLLGVVAPSVQRTIVEAGIRLGQLVATGFGIVLLSLVYLSVFTAGATWLRIRGIDPLNRSFPRNGVSNWIERQGYGIEKTLYSKQYSHPHGAPRPKASSHEHSGN